MLSLVCGEIYVISLLVQYVWFLHLILTMKVIILEIIMSLQNFETNNSISDENNNSKNH